MRRSDVFKALADPTRREILTVLRWGDQPVAVIASKFSISRPAVSRHLKVLKSADLVVETRDGRNRVYCLNTAPLRDVDDWISDYRLLWTNKLQSLKRYLEAKNRGH